MDRITENLTFVHQMSNKDNEKSIYEQHKVREYRDITTEKFNNIDTVSGRLIVPYGHTGIHNLGYDITNYSNIKNDKECLKKCLFDKDSNYPVKSDLTKAITYSPSDNVCYCHSGVNLG
jgi:hypothetical protein